MLEAQALALKRNKKEKRFGSKTYDGKNNSLVKHLIGLIGEIAVAHYFNVEVDKRIFHASGDDGIDLELEKYGKVQIKTTTYDPPWLRLEARKKFVGVDTFFLCYYNLSKQEVWIIGYCKVDKIQNRKTRRCRRDGPDNYIIKENELESII